VLKVLSDILQAIDDGNLSALVLLDLSAAFDTVGHHILLRRLKTCYRLEGMVLQWFESYLANRRQYVRTGSSTSSPSSILCGVPQGSVLGPILFLLYVADLLPLIESHGLRPHMYAVPRRRICPTGRLRGPQTFALCLVIAAGSAKDALINRQRSSISRCSRSSLELAATARHLCDFITSLQVATKNLSFFLFFSVVRLCKVPAQ
jgi:hypothetical protein